MHLSTSGQPPPNTQQAHTRSLTQRKKKNSNVVFSAMFAQHNRFKKKSNKNTYNYYDSGHDRSYHKSDDFNVLTAPRFLSQFKPKHDGKKLRTTSQLEPDTYCDFVAEVIVISGTTRRLTAAQSILIRASTTRNEK